MAYDISKKQILLEKLISQAAELDKKLIDTAGLEKECENKEIMNEDWLAKIELAEHNNNCLKHMKSMKKVQSLSPYHI